MYFSWNIFGNFNIQYAGRSLRVKPPTSWAGKWKKKQKKKKGRCVALFLLFQILFPAECSWVDRLSQTWWRCIIIVYTWKYTSTGSALLHYNLQLNFVEYWNISICCVCSPHVSEAAYYSSTDDCLPSVLERVPVFVRRILALTFCRGYSSWYEYLPMFLRVYASVDEYLPHVFGRVFGRRTNTCPVFLRWYSSVDEYLPHKPNTKPTNTSTLVPICIRIRAGCEILTRHCMFVL